jgi:hypothetical protein
MRNAIHSRTDNLESASFGQSVWQRLLARIGLAGRAGPKLTSVDAFEDVLYRLRDRPNEVPDFVRLAQDQDLAKFDPLPKVRVKGPSHR